MRMPPAGQSCAASALLSKRALAVYLGVTPRTIEVYQNKGLPYYRLGPRRNRYDIGAVRAWLERSCRVVRIDQ
ncbi:MAG: DNA-binding protein [Limisphaerales bacterium]